MAISKPPAKASAVEQFASKAAAPAKERGARRNILLSLPSELVEQIDDLAKRRYLNRTALVTVLVTEGMERAARSAT
jgi:hypothetical protein